MLSLNSSIIKTHRNWFDFKLKKLLPISLILVLVMLSTMVTPVMAAPEDTTTDSLTLIPTFECIGVYASFTGDTDANNSATLQYKEHSSAIWITGMDMTPADLEAVGYRCIALERLFNLRAGMAGGKGDRAEDYRRNGWNRTAVMKKAKVFDRLDIGDLWPLFRARA